MYKKMCFFSFWRGLEEYLDISDEKGEKSSKTITNNSKIVQYKIIEILNISGSIEGTSQKNYWF